MEGTPMANNFDRRPISRSQTRAVKWVKEWVPQDVVATGGKCYLLKWVTVDVVKALKEKENEPEKPEPEPEPTSEVLFLCSYEGCGKTFIDAGALRKHSHIHGERQYVCHWEGCGKKFLDSSKLKRHFLIHTGERDFICPHEGCGKAFSLDFNLRSHMKTHSQENYHICPYPECGKRYAHEYKLKNHIASYHEKNAAEGATKYSTPPPEKPAKASKPSSGNAYASAPSADRPYACPYEGCGKAYIHEYKLNLHLRREHPSHYADENHHRPTTHKTSQPTRTMDHVATTSNNNHNFSHHRMDHHREMVADEASDQEAYLVGAKRGSISGNLKSSKKAKVAAMAPNVRLPPLKIARKGNNLSASPASMNMIKKPSSWALQDEVYGGEGEDSEETEEDRGDAEDGWRYGDNDNDDDDDDDDEETEDED